MPTNFYAPGRARLETHVAQFIEVMLSYYSHVPLAVSAMNRSTMDGNTVEMTGNSDTTKSNMDADDDGSHITGLVINFLHYTCPSLLKIPGFLKFFKTPIVKAFRGKKVKEFYTMAKHKNYCKNLYHTNTAYFCPVRVRKLLVILNAFLRFILTANFHCQRGRAEGRG